MKAGRIPIAYSGSMMNSFPADAMAQHELLQSF